jgi:hypothetical protein
MENRVSSSDFLYSSIPRNITELNSSVPKPRKVLGTEEYNPLNSLVNRQIYGGPSKNIKFSYRRTYSLPVPTPQTIFSHPNPSPLSPCACTATAATLAPPLPPPRTSEDSQAPPRAVSARSVPPPPGRASLHASRPRRRTTEPAIAWSFSPLRRWLPSTSCHWAGPLPRRRRPDPRRSRHRVGPLRSGSPGPRCWCPDPPTIDVGPRPLPCQVFFEFCIEFENCLDENWVW